MNKYYKNFILCGDIDNYCLLCKESFRLIVDIEKHIRWETHRKTLKSLSYLPKFRKEFIFKVGDKYYCEKCNKITSNMTSLKAHVKSEKHNLLKNNPDAEIKKPAGTVDSGFVFVGKVLLNKAQWNSIVEDKCHICNVKVENIEQHAVLENHIINLIQCATKYTDDQHYRKISDELYHCFVCKKIYNAVDFENHLVSCENHDDVEIKKFREAKTGSRLTSFEKKLLESLTNCFIINEHNNVATCKDCKSLVAVNFNRLIEHLKSDHDRRVARYIDSSESEEEVMYNELVDYGKRRSELAKYGKGKFIKLNHNASKGYCMLCDKYFSANKKVFREHSRGAVHRSHFERLGLKKMREHNLFAYDVQNINAFVKRILYSPELFSVLIDGELSVNVESFFFLLDIKAHPQQVKTKCHACNDIFNEKEKRVHCLTETHISNFNASKVVFKKDEFIREIQVNLFHCGYCNITVSFRDILEKHVKTAEHIKLKHAKVIQAHTDTYSIAWNPSIIELVNVNGDFLMKLVKHVYE